MNFEQFEADFIKRNKLLAILLVSSLIMSSIAIWMLLARERYFVVASGEVFHERLLSKEVCLESFKSIAGDSPNSQLISDGILDILKDNPFLITIDKILKLKSFEEGTCKITLISNKKLRSFSLKLIQNDDFPFFYKLYQVDEVVIEKEDV
jgi:hypothetical protein